MAKAPESPETAPDWVDDHVLVTPDARKRLSTSEIWYHFGGWHDEGDTYETQEYTFQEELERFWMNLAGPEERLRRRILSCLSGIKPDWEAVRVSPDGVVGIVFVGGSVKTIQPPAAITTDA